MGRLPKPAKIRELEGNPSKRPIPEVIKAPEGMPQLSIELTPEAQCEFNRIVSHLRTMGILYETDGPTIERYLDAWQNAHDARLAIRRDGVTVPVETRTGTVVKKHPAFDVWASSTRLMSTILARLGFDPTSRMRLHVQPEGDADEGAAILKELKGA